MMRLKMKSRSYHLAIVLVSVLFFSSCVSYSTLHSPETLEPGKIGIHGGAAILINEDLDIGFLPEAGLRAGIAKNFDVGFKYSFPNTFMLDAKCQFLRGPVNAIADFGVSVFPIGDIITLAYYPTVIVEFRGFYAGGKFIFGNIDYLGGSMGIETPFSTLPVLITGVAIGKKKSKLLLEVNTYFNRDGRPLFIPAVGGVVSF